MRLNALSANARNITDILNLSITAAVPPFLWGSVGIGKTELVTEWLREAGVAHVVTSVLHLQPEDVGGVPVRVEDGTVDYVLLSPFKRLLSASSSSIAVLAVDEFSRADGRVQASLLKIINREAWGTEPIPPGFRVIAMGNEGVEEAPPPCDAVVTRFSHVLLMASPQDFCSYLRQEPRARVTPAPLAKLEAKLRQDQEYQSCVTVASAIVAQFIERNPSAHSFKDEECAEWEPGCGGLACSRTWKMVVDVLGAFLYLHPGKALTELTPPAVALIAGCVGNSRALQFLEFLKRMDLPSPDSLLQDPGLIDPILQQGRIDAAFVAVNAASIAVAQSKDKSLVLRALALAERAMDRGLGDAAVAAARPAIAAAIALDISLTEIPAQLRSAARRVQEAMV